MAAPNLKTPTTVTGRSTGYAIGTTLTATLSNVSSSGKVLKVVGAYCSNIDGTSATNVRLSLNNGTTDSYLAYDLSVPAGATQLLITREAPIYLEEGCSLKASAGFANRLGLVVAYEEVS